MVRLRLPPTLLIAILIAAIGILSIYSSSYQKEDKPGFENYIRQIFWVCLGLAMYLVMFNFNYRRLWDATYLLYGLVIFLLCLVFVLGFERLGAQRWLKIVWFNFQPSEIAKLTIVIFLAKYFSTKSADDTLLLAGKFGISRALIFPFLFIAIPVGLIIKQPDLGSGTIILSVFMAMLYLSGVKQRFIVIFLLVTILLLPVLWQFLREYQRERLLVFLNPNLDPLGAGYTVIQSKIAIGSGGLFGKGWLEGSQSQLHFLPESHTDFIFATFAEQWGLVGCSLLLLLYYLLIRQGIKIAFRTHDYFGRLLALGISLMLCIQTFINIAMTLGLAPVVGLPLPLMSYGGSSMVVTFTVLGILASIDKRRTVF